MILNRSVSGSPPHTCGWTHSVHRLGKAPVGRPPAPLDGGATQATYAAPFLELTGPADGDVIKDACWSP